MISAVQDILREGGFTVYALIALAFIIYAALFSVWQHLRSAEAALGSLNHHTARQGRRGIDSEFTHFELTELAWIERRLPVLAVLISAAPLLGLLGTVAGMLITFAGMATGNSAPIDTISSGISKALVTTQAGLVVAIPASLLLALVRRQTTTTRLTFQEKRHSFLTTAHSHA